MQNLIETYNRLLLEQEPPYKRKFYSDFRKEARFTGIVGARGVGKTTFLLNYLKNNYSGSDQALYVSADNLYFVEHTLLETADKFVKEYNGQLLCIDEVHRYKNWNQELKNIYDSYPKLAVMFSGSSSMGLIKGHYDLSRRVILKTMYGFSFREYLEVQERSQFSVITMSEIVKNHLNYAKDLMAVPKLLGHFKTYLKQGYLPTFMEFSTYDAYKSSLQNIVDKTIFEDVSAFYSLYTSSLDIFKKILYFFATSEPGGVNINKLAQSLAKDNSTISDYIQILKELGLLRFLLTNKHGHALVRDAEKIYLENTNLLYALNAEVGREVLAGTLRELFVIASMQNAGERVFFSPVGDIESEGHVFEIGGTGKRVASLKGVEGGLLIKDDVLLGDSRTIPLYLFGFLS